MEYARQFDYAPTALRLSGRQWGALAGLLALLCGGVPALWVRVERTDVGRDYRLPYAFSQDYWECARLCRDAARSGQVLLLGDSVVWGEYTGPADALPGQLNRLAGRAQFRNLGVNGLHPVALYGLVRHHGGALRGCQVVVVLNTLWMTSARHDLREAPADAEEAEGSFNHPALVPQFWPRVPRYTAGFEERASVVVERALPFLQWVSHLEAKSAYARAHGVGEDDAARPGRPAAGSTAAAEPRVDDPLPRPFAALLTPMPSQDPGAHSPPLSWEARGIPVSRIDWPAADESLQWRFFRTAVALLRARGNRVCVYVSPFNPYLQTPESQAAGAVMVRAMVGQLQDAGVTVCVGSPPPSAEYADASHPLAAGYERLAGELLASQEFQAWRAAAGP